MKFKSLLLNGFKSFADKTIIDFPAGVTCVVGPNGSGKSNILDAIRWVFGEQSPKELRGNDMEDIVFAGTTVRKPSGFGEVTLTVCDIPESVSGKWGTFSEISVTRKHYRSGEREYLINGRRCKLKDIKEIFYDTGIGAKSISIIEQGRVEKIIQSSPEDLRLFFEETAGIMKYKERKKEAERRLKQTRDNINRLNDIIVEVHKQRDILSSQLKLLTDYRNLKTELENSELSYYSNAYFNELSEAKKINQLINASKLNITSHIVEFEQLRKSEAELKSGQKNLETKLNDINNDIIANMNDINKLEADIKILNNNLNSAENTKNQLKVDIENLHLKLKEYSEIKENTKSETEILENELEDENEKLSNLTEELDELNYQKEDILDELNELKSVFVELTEEITFLRNTIFKTETETGRLQKDISNLENEKSVQSDTLKKIEPELMALRHKKLSVKEDMDIVKAKLDSLTTELYAKAKSKDELSGEINRLNVAKASMDSDLKNINSQIESIMFGDNSQKKHFQSFAPNLFVDFISQLDDGVKKLYGDLLIFHKKDEKSIIEYVDKMDASLKFSFDDKVDEILKDITTREYGEINNNLFRFGYIYHKIGRDNKGRILVELKDNLKKTESGLAQLTSELNGKQLTESKLKTEIENLKHKIDELENSKMLLEKEKIAVESKIGNYEYEIDKTTKRLSIIDNEIKFSKIEIGRKNDELQKLKSQLAVKGEKHLENEEQMKTIEDRISFYNDKIDDNKEVSAEIKTNIALLKEKISGNKKSIYTFEKEISNISSSISTIKNRLEKLLTVDISGWNFSVRQKAESLKDVMHHKVEVEQNKQFIVNELQEKLKLLDEISENIDDQNKIIKNIENEINNLEIKSAQIKQNISNLKEIFNDKFQRDLTDVYENYIKEDFKPSVLKSEIKQIDAKIEQLGALNLAAESEYNEVNERYEFLSKQREDLENAYLSINEVINEIDQNSVRNFTDTFHQVNENFKKVFKILFGDGVAELKLSEPDNMLNTGVEIFVQPPGKKLQNMNLLSGGEKAMTACTLIFAMFLCRPTPFCFLDEIDAPLDDANISRFTKIVTELSKDTQFLIITHNQKTMEAANSLYGITMEEPGVSKMISVRLS